MVLNVNHVNLFLTFLSLSLLEFVVTTPGRSKLKCVTSNATRNHRFTIALKDFVKFDDFLQLKRSDLLSNTTLKQVFIS